MTIVETSKARHALVSGRGKIFTLLAAAVAAVVLAACHFVGSGTMPSAYGIGSATFTFDLNCPTGGTATGVINYIDSPARVLARGVVPGTTKQLVCSSLSSSTTSGTIFAKQAAGVKPAVAPLPFGIGTFSGSYTSLKGGAGGTFSVTVETGGTNDPSSSGWVCIAFYGGVYDGYTNAGPVTWGNIAAFSS
jgi:hypothetical protein